MYTPKYFKETNPEIIRNFIKQNNFATIVSQVNGEPIASHLPLEYFCSEEGEYIKGHMARGNKQWCTFQNNQTILAMFLGPDAYISPSWYDHVNVPTWNYAAVHVYGKPAIIEDRPELLELLKYQVDKYEKNESGEYQLEALPKSFLETEILGVVGFKIKVERMEANFKLSQNRNQKNYEKVIQKLIERKEEKSVEVAKLMTENNPHSN